MGGGVWPVIRHQNELSLTADILRNGGRTFALQGEKIGEVLNAVGAIESGTLRAVEEHHRTKKINTKRIGQLLVQMGIIRIEELTRALCIQTGVPMVDLQFIKISRQTLDLVPNKQANEKKVIPVGVYHKTLYLAVANPIIFSEQSYYALMTQLNIKPVFSPQHEIETFLYKRTYIDANWTGAAIGIGAGESAQRWAD